MPRPQEIINQPEAAAPNIPLIVPHIFTVASGITIERALGLDPKRTVDVGTRTPPYY